MKEKGRVKPKVNDSYYFYWVTDSSDELGIPSILKAGHNKNDVLRTNSKSQGKG